MDIIKNAQDLFRRDKDAWSEIYKKGKEDIRFLSDDDYAQWDQREAEARRITGRPAITIDQLNQFVHQVANDIRMNTPTINVIPGDNKSSEKTAEIYKGLIKKIEYHSQADSAYDTSVTSAIKGSVGFIRVDHDYSDDETDLQDLFIRRVTNPFAITIDSNSIEVDGSDAKHGHIVEPISYDDFKKRFPKKEVVSFESENGEACSKDEKVYICEFFKIEEIDGEKVGNRQLKKRIVRRYTLSGKDILEETTFPGRYVPIVPVYGEEAWQDGKRNIHSLIRKSKEAQRMFNYWKSLETEILMKQPQAPWVVAAGSIENYAADWQNPEKAIALRYDVEKDGKPLPPPQRTQPPNMPAAIINASREAVDDIKATMGIYNASLGAKSNETSGVAINQRKIEGDVATYHFGDNLIKSISHVGKILVCAIPEVYDTARIVRIIGEEGDSQMVGINGHVVDGQEDSYMLSEGRYDVRVVTGAPFTTRRQEAMAALQETFKAAPELMRIMGDLYFKNADFAGAQAMAERMEKVIDPKFLEEDDDQEKIQLQQAIQAAQAQIQELSAQLQNKQQSEQAKTQIEVFKIQSEQQRAQLEAETTSRENQLEQQRFMADIEIKAAELRLKEREIALKEAELMAKIRELSMRPAEIEQSGSIQ